MFMFSVPRCHERSVSPKPLTIVPSDCCCRLAGSRYATHVGCLPQPFPVGESDLCKRRSESTPPITAFHSQDMNCKIEWPGPRKIEWPGPRRWCNLSLYCLFSYRSFHASHTGLLLAAQAACVVPSLPCLPSSLYSACLVHTLPPTVLPLKHVQPELHSSSAFFVWFPG